MAVSQKNAGEWAGKQDPEREKKEGCLVPTFAQNLKFSLK